MNEKKGITIGAVRLLMWVALTTALVLAVITNYKEIYAVTFLMTVAIITVEISIVQKLLAGVQYLVSDEYKYKGAQGTVVGVSNQKPLEN